MTKPANFPGRKNARRVAALYRGPSIHSEEGTRLLAKIVPNEQAIAIRTKKDRRDRASVR